MEIKPCKNNVLVLNLLETWRTKQKLFWLWSWSQVN